MQNRLFRKISIERLSSPDQLDLLLQITRPRGWVALTGLGLLVFVGLGWGIFGRVSNRVQGEGILIRSGGVLEVVAPVGGRVTDVSVEVGDSITEGQVIAWLAQPELSDQLQRARDQLEATRQEFAQAVDFAARHAQLQQRSLDQQGANVEASIAAAEENLRWLEERLSAQEQLFEKGLIAKPTLLATRQQYDDIREKIRAHQDERAKLDLQRLDVENRREAAVRDIRFKLQQAEREWAQLEFDLKSSTQVVSMHSGRVLEIMTEPGKVVNRGEPIMSLDRTGGSVQELVAVIYVPPLLGKMVRPGMRVQIAPSTVRKEEFGLMIGHVTFVSSFPATSKGMSRILKNEQLVQQLSGGAAPYEVHASLQMDPSTASRYRWTSGKGPPIRIESGTLAAATIIVGEQMPLAMVLPIVRNL